MTSAIVSKHTIKPFSEKGQINIIFLMAFWLITFVSAASLQASEMKMLALVSDRSAASMVAGAHQFLATQSADTAPTSSSINIRSVSQLNIMTNKEIQQLINQHQALVIAGVFGESVERLLALTYPENQTRLMLNTDRRLMALHQDINAGNAANLPKQQLQSLMAALDKNDYLSALKAKQAAMACFCLLVTSACLLAKSR